MAVVSFPETVNFRKPRFLATGAMCPGETASGRVLLHPTEALLPAFPTLDPVTGAIGRRPSGARLYHRNSRFGPPECRPIERNMRVRLLHLAKALDHRTRQPGQHGG